MPIEELSFDDAEKLIRANGERFNRGGVVGLGVSERKGAISFVVGVKDNSVRRSLAQEFRGQKVDGLPVHVEVTNLVPITHDLNTDGDATSLVTRQPSEGLARAILDRPGFLVVAAAIATAFAMLFAL